MALLENIPLSSIKRISKYSQYPWLRIVIIESWQIHSNTSSPAYREIEGNGRRSVLKKLFFLFPPELLATAQRERAYRENVRNYKNDFFPSSKVLARLLLSPNRERTYKCGNGSLLSRGGEEGNV